MPIWEDPYKLLHPNLYVVGLFTPASTFSPAQSGSDAAVLTEALRLAQGERCTARYAPARALDALVWQDLCRVLTTPALMTHELERAQMGAWLPQALQARRQSLRALRAQFERQQARLLDFYLAEVIEREEFERRRKEVAQTQHGLRQQLRQRDAQAQQHVNVVALAQGIAVLCQRIQPTLDMLTCAQRRHWVALLIDRGIVADWERAPFLSADQGQGEEGQPWNGLAIQTGKEPIQSMGLFARFGDHDFIASQQVDLIWTVDMLMKEHPKQHRPRERLGEKALDGAVTTARAFAGVALPRCQR